MAEEKKEVVESKKEEKKEERKEEPKDGYTKRRIDHKKAEELIKKEREEMKEIEEKIALANVGKLSMWLEDYDDLFSDFDPRPYGERAISDDFINEYQKMLRDTAGGEQFELRFLVPKEVRNEKEEEVIKKRLRNYFKNIERDYSHKVIKITKTGVLLTILGALLMMVAAGLNMSKVIISKFLIVIVDPAGWFLVWYGLDQIFYNAAEKRKHLSFYEKTSRTDIIFSSY